MRVSTRRRLIEKDGSFYICIPARMRKALGWEKGKFLTFYRNGDNELYISFENNTAPDHHSLKNESPG